MKSFLLAGLILLSIQHSHASGAFDELDVDDRSQPSPRFSVEVSATAAQYSEPTNFELKIDDDQSPSHFAVQVPLIIEPIAADKDVQTEDQPISRSMSRSLSRSIVIAETREDPPTKCQLCLPWFEMTLGTGLEVLGASSAAAGGVILLTWNDPTMMTIGAAMACVGSLAERGGNLLTLNADHHAAKVERLLNEDVRKLTTEDLTPEQEEILSAAFYGKSEDFMRFAGCANCFDKVASVVCKLFGAPLGLAGIGISKRTGSDSIVGTCVSAVGAAMYKLGDFYGKKAEKRTAQLKRIGEINKTKGIGVTV